MIARGFWGKQNTFYAKHNIFGFSSVVMRKMHKYTRSAFGTLHNRGASNPAKEAKMTWQNRTKSDVKNAWDGCFLNMRRFFCLICEEEKASFVKSGQKMGRPFIGMSETGEKPAKKRYAGPIKCHVKAKNEVL